MIALTVFLFSHSLSEKLFHWLSMVSYFDFFFLNKSYTVMPKKYICQGFFSCHS